ICISATHAAFDSLRMEPVYMSMGHAAGTAACLAIDNATNVQSVDYTELSTHLANEGQVFIDPDRLADLSIR
ncbi:MAG: FAD-dependent oxidoreductase, partial [Verrucomicrobia bacterium]